MLSRSIWPAPNRWRNATQSPKRLRDHKCSVTDGRSACISRTNGANVSSSANRSCSSQTSSSQFMIYIIIWLSSLGGTCSKRFLWLHFVGIFISTRKRIGLAFTLDNVGIVSFQLYSSRVIVFISQHRLLPHTLNFIFLYRVRPVESVIGQSNDTVFSGCSIITCRMTSNAVPNFLWQ